MTTLQAAHGQHATLAAICLAALVLPIDFSGVAVATDAIGHALPGGPVALAWVVNAFMLTFGCSLLTMGALADVHGRRRVFLGGLSLFVLVSLLLCVAPSLVWLDIGRAVQGLAAAATLAGGTAALAQEFDGAARTRALSLLGATFGAGLAFGPSIAGLLLATAGWRAIFLTGAAIGLVALLVALPRLRETRDPLAQAVDWPGGVAFTLALTALTAATLEAPARGWTSPVVVSLLGTAFLLGHAFVVVERRTARPMLDLSLFREPRFVGVQALPVATCFGYVVLLVLLPARLIGLEGRGAAETGLVMLALSLPMLVVPPLAARLSLRLPAGPLSAGGLAVAALGLLWLAALPLGVGAAALAMPLAVIGCGAAVPWGLMDALSLSVVPRERAGMATGIFSTVRVAGEGIAIAAARALLDELVRARVGDSHGVADVAALVVGGAAAARRDPVLIAAAGGAFVNLLYILAALVVASAVVILATLRDRRGARSEACAS